MHNKDFYRPCICSFFFSIFRELIETLICTPFDTGQLLVHHMLYTDVAHQNISLRYVYLHALYVQYIWWKLLIHSLRELVGRWTVACPSQRGVTVAWLGFSLSAPHLPRRIPANSTRPSPVWLTVYKTVAE